MVILLFLEIKVEKNKGSMLHAFKRLLNPATGVYFTILLGLGIGLGIFNYVPLYLQDEMEASSAMIGEYFLTVYYFFYEIEIQYFIRHPCFDPLIIMTYLLYRFSKFYRNVLLCSHGSIRQEIFETGRGNQYDMSILIGGGNTANFVLFHSVSTSLMFCILCVKSN